MGFFYTLSLLALSICGFSLIHCSSNMSSVRLKGVTRRIHEEQGMVSLPKKFERKGTNKQITQEAV
jgi:hypothetical protein